MDIFCYQCCNKLEWKSFVPRSEECPHCYADIHVCRMCKFYDRSCYNECREPSAERVINKEKANFCDYFKLASNGQGGKKDKKSLLEKANLLFKG